MAYRTDESGKWALAVHKVADKLGAAVDKSLSDNAARGFCEATGPTLEAVLKASQEAKGLLTEENGKIYDDRRGAIFAREEFDMNMAVKLAKLGMELYREELLHALALEQAENTAMRDKGRADVDRIVSMIEARQADIIRARAAVEQRVIGYKVQLAMAERETLTSEIALVNAQLSTAQKKLEIIDSIYQVLAAEELVLAAEYRRVAALELSLSAHRAVAAAKLSLVPLYAQRAGAKIALAGAITAEVPQKIAIEELGYQRAALKVAEGETEHGVRTAELVVEVARAGLARANAATEVARARSQAIIQGFSNAAQSSITGKRLAAGMAEVDVRMATHLGRAGVEINSGVAVAAVEAANLSIELGAIQGQLAARAADEAVKVRSSATTKSQTKAIENSDAQVTTQDQVMSVTQGTDIGGTHTSRRAELHRSISSS